MYKPSENKSKISKFNEIVSDIKAVKIQGAGEIARKALIAYSLFPNEKTEKMLLSLRPTEPMMFNLLKRAKTQSVSSVLNELDESQRKINVNVLKIIEKDDIIFTHCHSNTLVNSLIYAKNKGGKFNVYVTETRPLFQGRRTVTGLIKNGVEVEMFVDSAAMMIFSGKGGIKPPTKFIIGADALTKNGIINKIGSGMFAKLSWENKIPVYVVSNSLKFTTKKIPIEQRPSEEIWKNAPKGLKISNPAFEEVDKKYITKIISDFGILSYEEFLRKMV